MRLALPVCWFLATLELSCLALEGLVVRSSSKQWVAAPADGLRVFTPKQDFLESSALPFGLPPSVWNRTLPFTVDEQEQINAWQNSEHGKLERQLGFVVTGYVTHWDLSTPPLLVRELPGVVGTQIWAGEWLLWSAVSRELQGNGGSAVKRVLEVGAGCGLCGLLLAASGLDVLLSDTSSGYDGAAVTWSNLVDNVEANTLAVEAAGGRITALDLDWASGQAVPQVDLTVGADVIYDPQQCRHLMATLRRSSRRAILIQNVARAGTEAFRALAKVECASFRAVAILPVEMAASLPAADGWMDSFPATDGRRGRYEAWHLTFDDSEERCHSAAP